MNSGKDGEYTIAKFGLNCLPDAVIKDKYKCVEALQQLGISVRNLNVNKTERPAGCYWSSGYEGYFNAVVNTTLTEPSLFGERSGVCNSTESGMNSKTHPVSFKKQI